MEESIIGKKIYKGQYTSKEYADTAVWCNNNNAHLEDKGEYYEVVENMPYEPTVEEKLTKLENQYQIPRVLREIILANPNMYSQFIVGRAKELEELAEIIRKKGK